MALVIYLGALYAVNNSVTQIDVVERRVVGVVVGDEQVDVEAEIINLTDTQSLSSEPVAVRLE